MKRLFKKQVNKKPNKKLRIFFIILLLVAAILGVVFYTVNQQKSFKYDALAGKQKIEDAREKIYKDSDYQAAVDSLAQSAEGSSDVEKYNILVEEGSYLVQLNQLDKARDIFETAKKIGGYENPLVGIVLGAYYLQNGNKDVARQHYLGVKQVLEQRADTDQTKKSALENVNEQLKGL